MKSVQKYNYKPFQAWNFLPGERATSAQIQFQEGSKPVLEVKRERQ